MKRTEIATIILIAAVSIFLTFMLVQWLAGTILKDQIRREVKVPVSQEISSDIAQPSKRIFNRDAINPTVEVCVEVADGLAGEGSGSAACRADSSEVQGHSGDNPAKDTATPAGAKNNTN